MDQLRQFFSWLGRYHFWVLTVVATIVALGCWFQGVSTLYGELTQNKQKIEAEFTKMSNLQQQQFHANADINKQQELENAEQRKQVNALWQQLYERQRADVLQWPSNLSEDFHRRVEKLRFGDKIPGNLCAHYNNYVGDHFPELPKIVGALELSENVRGAAGGRGGRGMMEGRGGPMEGGFRGGDLNDMAAAEEDYIVLWHDQERVRGELYMPSTPSSKRIWVTQEDLWVYEALLGIIARTNQAAGADRYSNAKIRDIYSLEVGARAAQASRGAGRIAMVRSADGGMEGMDSMRGMEGMGGMEGRMGGMEGGFDGMDYASAMGGGRGGFDGMDRAGGGMDGRGGGMGGGLGGDAALFASRYLGADGKPVQPTGEGGPDEFGKEFKRLPIRMQLEMDQRWLPHLISECANAPLQVEVTEVRINPTGGIKSSGSGRGSFGRGGGGRSGGLAGGQNGEPMVPEHEPNIKPVIIQGTIFIFNPPSDDMTDQQVAVTQ